LSGGEGGDALSAAYSGTLMFTDINFDACSGNHIYAAGAGASVIAMGNYQIIGGAVWHAEASTSGYIELSASDRHVAVTLSGTPNFSGGFAVAAGASLAANNNSFPGTGATGPKYNAQLNGVIWTAGKSANYFPGSVAGSTSTGGQYG
jgi:hypothetical protein